VGKTGKGFMFSGTGLQETAKGFILPDGGTFR